MITECSRCGIVYDPKAGHKCEHKHSWIRVSPNWAQPVYHCECGDGYSDRANY